MHVIPTCEIIRIIKSSTNPYVNYRHIKINNVFDQNRLNTYKRYVSDLAFKHELDKNASNILNNKK